MPRPSMLHLVQRVRAAVGDTGTPPVFTDDEVQAALERWGSHRALALQPVLAIGQGETDRWVAPLGDWEADSSLVDSAGQPVAVAVADWASGRFQLAAPHAGPLYLVGWTYDLAGAVADLLEEWASRLAHWPALAVDGTSVDVTQQVQQLRLAASLWRQRQRVVVGQLARPEDAGW